MGCFSRGYLGQQGGWRVAESSWNALLRIQACGNTRPIISASNESRHPPPTVRTSWLSYHRTHPELLTSHFCLHPSSTGSVKLKVLPLFTALSNQIRPPCSSTSLRVMLRPRPVPPTSSRRGLSAR